LCAKKFLARVMDSAGVPVPATPVTWTIVSGGGSFSPSVTSADSNGLVTTTYTLADKAGQVRVRATLGQNVTRDFDIQALPGSLAQITPLYTDFSLRVGSSFTGTVKAIDGYGNGVPGVVLTSRPGDIQYTALVTTPTEPATQTTDANGNATFVGTTAGLPGLQSFEIDGPLGPAFTPGASAWFRVRASADRGYVAPSVNQRTVVTTFGGATLEFDVVVIQADGTPAVHAPVVFSVASGNGSIVDASGTLTTSLTSSTDANSGLAFAKWRLPAAPGTYSMIATSGPPNDGGSPLTFAVTVVP
jgi:hypothetical protein